MKQLAIGFLLTIMALPVFGEGKDPFAMDSQVYLGAVGGVSVPDADGTTQRTGYGFEAGAKLSDEFGVGAFFLTSNKEELAGNGLSNFEFDYAIYGVEANYLFDGSAAGAYVGARAGLSKVSKVLDSGKSYAISPFVWGLQAGYDYMLGTHLSLGAQMNAMFVSGGSMDTTTGLIVGPFDVLNFLGVVKFWF